MDFSQKSIVYKIDQSPAYFKENDDGAADSKLAKVVFNKRS